MSDLDITVRLVEETDRGYSFALRLEHCTSRGTHCEAVQHVTLATAPSVSEVYRWWIVCDVEGMSKPDRIIAAEYISRRIKEQIDEAYYDYS